MSTSLTIEKNEKLNISFHRLNNSELGNIAFITAHFPKDSWRTKELTSSDGKKFIFIEVKIGNITITWYSDRYE